MKVTKVPGPGDNRIIKIFCFLPRVIGNETKWLKTVSILQKRVVSILAYPACIWIDVAFVNNSPWTDE